MPNDFPPVPSKYRKGIKPNPGSGRKVVDGSDRGGYPADETTRRYLGSKSGVWTNANGTEVGRSNREDSTIVPGKSTGDRVTDTFIAQRRKAKTKGY